MNRELIWDLPTRLIHWALAAGLLAAFLIAQFGGEHSGWFDYHALIGLTLAMLLVLRMVWGIVGTRHARFSSYRWSPVALAAYLRGVVRNKHTDNAAAHNPATSWAAVLMFVLLVIVIATGVMMGRGNEAAEEIHELAVYAMLAVVGVHVAGVVLHMVRRKENLVLGMLDGRKPAETSLAIRSTRPLAGVLVLALAGVFAGRLIADYDPAAHHTHLPLIGSTILVGEAESDRPTDARGSHHEEDDD